jgi:hypothetical protein
VTSFCLVPFMSLYVSFCFSSLLCFICSVPQLAWDKRLCLIVVGTNNLCTGLQADEEKSAILERLMMLRTDLMLDHLSLMLRLELSHKCC